MAHWTFDGNLNYNPASGSVAIVINRATATVSFNSGTLAQTFDGSVKTVATSTTPGNLTVNVSFTGTLQNAGSYPVTGTINDANY